jgi:hypothetical protein
MIYRFSQFSLLFLPLISFAKTDSIPKRVVKQRYDVWYHAHDPNKLYNIDTSIFQLHRNDFLTNDGVEFLHLGNTGTAAFPLIFQPKNSKGFRTGFHQFDAYKFTMDSLRYFKAQRPYTELSYLIGLQLEQIFRGRFFHSLKNGLDYGVDFFRINSRGGYNRQQALNTGFYFYAKYTPKSNRFGLYTNLIFHQAKVNENGGLTRDYFATDTTFFRNSLVPTTLSGATNRQAEWNWNAGADIFLGNKIITKSSDTSSFKKVIPKFKFGYAISVTSNVYSFLDESPDSLYYGNYFISSDPVFNQHKFLNIGNEINFEYIPKRVDSDSTYKEQFLAAGGKVKLDYWVPTDFSGRLPFSNLYVEGYVKSNTAFKSPLHFEGRVRYFLAGYNQNDLMVGGTVSAKIKDYVEVNAAVSYNLFAPAFIENRFASQGYTAWINDFKKQNEFVIRGRVYSPKIKVGAEVSNTVLKDFIFYNEGLSPVQEARAMNVFSVRAFNRFGIKGFHLDNDIWYQSIAGGNAIQLPNFVSKHSIYYENRLFKRAVWFALGFDVRFNTAFNAYGYNPFIGQFFVQEKRRMVFTPGWDVFLNLKVKTVRVSLLGNHLGELIKGRPNYNAYLYPNRAASFRFFVSWRFLE